MSEQQIPWPYDIIWCKFYLLFIFKDFIWERETEIVTEIERAWVGEEREKQACGAESQDPKIMTWAKGRCLTDWAPLPHTLSFCLWQKEKSTSRLRGAWVAQSAKCLPLAQVMILGSWDRAPHCACTQLGSLVLPPLTLVLSFVLCLFLSNK